MTIVVDTRELRSIVPKQLENLKVSLTYSALEIGDYLVVDVPVERKSASDFIQSFQTGHLDKQLNNMSYHYKRSFLILEGDITSALIDSKTSRHAVLGKLASTAIKVAPDGEQGFINVIHVDSPYDTALLLKYLHDCIQSGEFRLPRIERVPFGGQERLVYILSSFPEIGEVRAKNLLKKFKGFKGLVNAKVEKLSEVDGIGKKTAKILYDTLHKKVEII